MHKFANNAVGSLASAISNVETSITVSGDEGGRFPSLTPGDYFMATIVDEDGNREIVRVTARVGNTLTVQRGQEGTIARSFKAGSKVSHRLTAGALGEFLQRAEAFDQFLPRAEANETYIKKSEGVFPSGTRMLFQQTNAPTGWTKDTTHDNKALRVVSGTAGSGGNTAFTSVFTNRTITRENLPNINLTGSTGSAGGHDHEIRYYTLDTSIQGATQKRVSSVGYLGDGIGNTRPVGDHSHTISLPLGGSGTPLDFRVQYVDVIIAQKD